MGLVIADLHIHSKYSKATSTTMDLPGLAEGAKRKGLNLLGTGDFTHPMWLKELKSSLLEIEGAGLYLYNGVYFMLTTEVSTVFKKNREVKKIHHVIHAPSFEIVDQINDALSKYGDLTKDGRPTLNMTAAELVEELMQISRDIVITPAHIWTPWYSLFGSRSGFDSVYDCFEDQTGHIFSLETGLSSDPAMNWRLSQLDKYTLLSNSDSHSPHPWRLGREVNVLMIDKVSYYEFFDTIRRKDRRKFLYTIEVSPNYGKYHYDGHRKCGVKLTPKEAMKYNNRCPVCRKPLTIGVLHRVEELADREEGYVPSNAIPFKTLLPLCEIIATVLNSDLYSKQVIEEHDRLIAHFGSELDVLLNASYEELCKVTNRHIASAIVKVRENKVSYDPGYDGVYGKLILSEEANASTKQIKESPQKSLENYWARSK